jgi:hypothetical protein
LSRNWRARSWLARASASTASASATPAPVSAYSLSTGLGRDEGQGLAARDHVADIHLDLDDAVAADFGTDHRLLPGRDIAARGEG